MSKNKFLIENLSSMPTDSAYLSTDNLAIEREGKTYKVNTWDIAKDVLSNHLVFKSGRSKAKGHNSLSVIYTYDDNVSSLLTAVTLQDGILSGVEFDSSTHILSLYFNSTDPENAMISVDLSSLVDVYTVESPLCADGNKFGVDLSALKDSLDLSASTSLEPVFLNLPMHLVDNDPLSCFSYERISSDNGVKEQEFILLWKGDFNAILKLSNLRPDLMLRYTILSGEGIYAPQWPSNSSELLSCILYYSSLNKITAEKRIKYFGNVYDYTNNNETYPVVDAINPLSNDAMITTNDAIFIPLVKNTRIGIGYGYYDQSDWVKEWHEEISDYHQYAVPGEFTRYSLYKVNDENHILWSQLQDMKFDNLPGYDYWKDTHYNWSEYNYGLTPNYSAAPNGKVLYRTTIDGPWLESDAIISDGILSGFNEKGTAVEIILPRKDENGYNIESIGNGAFLQCDSLLSIIIPNSVSSIGNGVFYYCSSLSSITIPDSVTSIGNQAFSYCSSLLSITIPNSVSRIESQVFYYCNSLSSITIPDSVTSIGNQAFSYCSSLLSITIPDSVTSIGYETFLHCGSLSSIIIPNSVSSIEYGVFYYCDSLSHIKIPDSVTSIGDHAFAHCNINLVIITANGGNSQNVKDMMIAAGVPENIQWIMPS